MACTKSKNEKGRSFIKPQFLNLFLLGTIAVLFAGFAGQVGYQYWLNKPEPVVLAAWAFDPRTLGEAKGLAKEIVEAQVTQVERADDLVIPAPGEPGGVERIAIEVVSMKVKGAMKGQHGQEIKLHRTAGKPITRSDISDLREAPPRPKGASDPPRKAMPFVENTINIHDEQNYRVGETYVMFLREGPQVRVNGQKVNTKILLNPSTRFRVEPDNRVMPTIPDGLGRAFKGKPLQQFKTDILQAAERGPVPGKIPGQLVLPPIQIQPGMMPGKIQPRGIEGTKRPEDMDMEMELGEIEVPTEGEAPELQ